MRQKRFWIVGLTLALLPLRHMAWATTYTVTNIRDGGTGSLPLERVRYAPPPPTLWVTNTNDSGSGSLRQAITDANSSSGRERVAFNIPPSDPNCDAGTGVCTIQPTTLLPWLIDDAGLIIDGYTQDGAARATATTAAVLTIELDGGNGGGSGLWIDSSNNVIRGLAINRFDQGITIYDVGATDNVVQGNHIGTDASGTVDLGNIEEGVRIVDGAQDNTIGGDEPADRNVISGNGDDGVYISWSGTTGNVVQGNYIGLAANGTDPLGNDGSGITLNYGAANNIIGGSDSRHRNVISANDDYGIEISDTDTASNAVSRNYIGTDAGGTLDRGNGLDGVYIHGDADNNTVEYNVISGNGQLGVLIADSDGNTVSDNSIGVAANRVDPLGNSGSGIIINVDADDNSIGPDNVIAYNNSDGVQVSGAGGDSTGNIITQNSIFSNDMGIDLTIGANGGIAAPVIVTTTAGSVHVVGTACAGCTVEVFENSDADGEGETYVGDTTATTSGAFTVTVSSLSDPYLTATATDATDGTSEFSDVFMATVTGGGSVYLPIILKNH
jgi:parallel beta-helix repeat protein